MSRPVQEKSVSGANSTTKGSALEIGGRITVTLFVVAKSGDTVNDTVDVDLEVSQDGTNWAKLRDESGTQVGQVTASEFDDPDGNSDPAAMVTVHGVAADRVRANLKNFTDAANSDLTVDAIVGATSNPKTAKGFRSR